MGLFKKVYNISFYRIKYNAGENTYECISDAGILECLKILQKAFSFDVISTSFSNTSFERDKITIKCYPADKMEIVRLFCLGLHKFIEGVKC